jgi:hypothetical protein
MIRSGFSLFHCISKVLCPNQPIGPQQNYVKLTFRLRVLIELFGVQFFEVQSMQKGIRALAALAIAGVALSTFGHPTNVTAAPVASGSAAQKAKAQEVTARLTKMLRKRIKSPGSNLQLRVVPTVHADQGYFSEVFISATPAQIKDIRFSSLTLRARNVRISPTALLEDHSIRTLSSVTTMRAVVTEAEVTSALAKGEDSADKKLTVKFVGDKIRVSGMWKWSWFSGPMEAIGQLKLGTAHTIVADIQSLKLNGKEVPQGLKNKFMEKINPLLDYTELPFRPPFKSIRFIGNKAVIST